MILGGGVVEILPLKKNVRIDFGTNTLCSLYFKVLEFVFLSLPRYLENNSGGSAEMVIPQKGYIGIIDLSANNLCSLRF